MAGTEIKSPAMIERINKFVSISSLLVFYWAMYWLMNGLDKFLNRTDLGLFAWHGKDRTEQFTNYFSNSALPVKWIDGLLYFVGIWEILIFLCLVKSLVSIPRLSRLDYPWFEIGMKLGLITFIGFSFFDVIFGDRAELLEHGTFLILVVLTLHYIRNSEMAMPSAMRRATNQTIYNDGQPRNDNGQTSNASGTRKIPA